MYSCTDGDRVPQISRGRGRLASESMQTLDLMRYAMTSPSHMGLNDYEQYTEGVTGSQHVFSSHGFVFDMDIDTNGEYEELLLLGVGILSDGEARWYVEATAQVGDEGLAVPTITCIQGKHVWEDHYHDGAGCLG